MSIRPIPGMGAGFAATDPSAAPAAEGTVERRPQLNMLPGPKSPDEDWYKRDPNSLAAHLWRAAVQMERDLREIYGDDANTGATAPAQAAVAAEELTPTPKPVRKPRKFLFTREHISRSNKTQNILQSWSSQKTRKDLDWFPKRDDKKRLVTQPCDEEGNLIVHGSEKMDPKITYLGPYVPEFQTSHTAAAASVAVGPDLTGKDPLDFLVLQHTKFTDLTKQQLDHMRNGPDQAYWRGVLGDLLNEPAAGAGAASAGPGPDAAAAPKPDITVLLSLDPTELSTEEITFILARPEGAGLLSFCPNFLAEKLYTPEQLDRIEAGPNGQEFMKYYNADPSWPSGVIPAAAGAGASPAAAATAYSADFPRSPCAMPAAAGAGAGPAAAAAAAPLDPSPELVQPGRPSFRESSYLSGYSEGPDVGLSDRRGF